MKVHATLGTGFQELIYQRALAIEMRIQGLFFEREKEMKIYYNDEEIGTRRADFFAENMIMIELKAISALEDIHIAQSLNYLETYKLPVGLLINFGARSLEYKRVYNSRHPDNVQFLKSIKS